MDKAMWLAISKQLALSPLQTRIVELILRGRQDQEIAAELNLSVPTVRTYLKRMRDMIGCITIITVVMGTLTFLMRSWSLQRLKRATPRGS